MNDNHDKQQSPEPPAVAPSPLIEEGLRNLEQNHPEPAPGVGIEGTVLPPEEPILDPWKPWVALARHLVESKVDNWTWPNEELMQGTGGATDWFYAGIEKQLTKWMPRGLIDLEKYPLIMTAVGAALIVVANTDPVKVKGKKRWQVRPLFKADIEPEPPAPQAAPQAPTAEGPKAPGEAPKPATAPQAKVSVDEIFP